jgi:hypothetical protein
MNYTKRIRTVNVEFHNTCCACPEQYDVLIEGKQVAYVRLRWGNLNVTIPDVGGQNIYSYSWDDGFLGQFPNNEEREYHLDLIAQILYNINNAETD